MAKPARLHVVRVPEGGWGVRKPNAERVSFRHKTQAEAEAHAKEMLARAGGGEVVIHNREGQIRDCDTVPPGNDPTPPKDTRY